MPMAVGLVRLEFIPSTSCPLTGLLYGIYIIPYILSRPQEGHLGNKNSHWWARQEVGGEEEEDCRRHGQQEGETIRRRTRRNRHRWEEQELEEGCRWSCQGCCPQGLERESHREQGLCHRLHHRLRYDCQRCFQLQARLERKGGESDE